VKKAEIRKKILKIRKQNYNKNIEINFKSILKILKNKKNTNKIVGGYYPYNYEINAIEILEKFEKLSYQVSLPKIKKNSQMDFFNWSHHNPLEINRYGIPEPISNKVKYPDILLVPLLAFDEELNRIGYGGGFYDRYIKRIKKIKKIITIGLAYSFQKVRKIEVDKHDIKLDFIITEKN
jgi:5-formyltetrahydrofolate cyclo-ligase